MLPALTCNASVLVLEKGTLAQASRSAHELAADDEDVAEHVKQLEEFADATNLPEAPGDAITMEFELSLKRREPGN